VLLDKRDRYFQTAGKTMKRQSSLKAGTCHKIAALSPNLSENIEISYTEKAGA
jgi:hypothetical protein